MFRSVGVRWVALGLAGSCAITVAGADVLRNRPIGWWFDSHVPGATVIVYAGIAALCCAWLAVGRRLSRSDGGGRVFELLLVGAVWCVPLLLAPALFSRDMFSYLADGWILHHGLDPYRQSPAVLAQLHQGQLLHAVSDSWRHTTAPYGPAFVGLAAVVSAVVGSHLVAGVLLLRLIEVAGVAVLAVFVPRLARLLGADPVRATWLAVISPLVVLELVAAGHNDALMAGLLVAGVTFALERRPLLAITLCMLAATIKLPAIAGVAMITIAWARAEPGRAVRVVCSSAVVCAAVMVVVSALTGLGLDWLSGSLSTPAKVRIAITPSTALGHSLAGLLHGFGVRASASGFESAVGLVMLGLTAGLGLWLCARVRFETLVPYLGLLLLVSVLGGPAAWPWYGIWGLALIACWPPAMSWRWLPLVIAATPFLIRADGRLIIHRSASPATLALYLLGVAVLLWRWRGWDPRLSAAAEFAR